MESGNLSSLRHSQQVLDNVSHRWPKDLHNSGYWLFKPQYVSLKRSLQSTGIKLIDCTYIGRGYQYELAIQIDSHNSDNTVTWKAENEQALEINIGDNVALEYTATPHWLDA